MKNRSRHEAYLIRARRAEERLCEKRIFLYIPKWATIQYPEDVKLEMATECLKDYILKAIKIKTS